MKGSFLLLIAAAFIAGSCNNQENANTVTENADSSSTVSSDTTSDGWQSLFDGQTTKGWHAYGKTAAGEAWKVKDGAIYLDTAQKDGGSIKGGGDMVSDEEFENFHLKLDWKIAKNGNSGIMFYVHEDTAKYERPYFTGPEMQVLDNDGHKDGKINKHRAGDLYDLIASSSEPVKPVGEWNTAEIIANNGKLDFVLNGTKIVSTTMWDDNWKKMVAGSKFKQWPDFGTYRKGRIVLQDHNDEVWYRNIQIKKL